MGTGYQSFGVILRAYPRWYWLDPCPPRREVWYDLRREKKSRVEIGSEFWNKKLNRSY